MYLLLFSVGLIGFLLMTAFGFLHVGNHSVGGHHSPLGHVPHAGGPALPHTGGVHLHHAPGTPTTNESSGPWFAFSLMDVFSLAMGGGAAGLLLRTVVAPSILPVVAVVGALGFCFGMVRPLVNALSSFASKPSEGLEGMVARNAVAITKFDPQGRGLIRLTLDGQSVQVLAHLESDEVQRGIRVAKGDPVTIVEVDKERNACRVTRELNA